MRGAGRRLFALHDLSSRFEAVVGLCVRKELEAAANEDLRQDGCQGPLVRAIALVHAGEAQRAAAG